MVVGTQIFLVREVQGHIKFTQTANYFTTDHGVLGIQLWRNQTQGDNYLQF